MHDREIAATVAIIVPIRNGREHVGPLIQQLEATATETTEILVVDDGSTDGTSSALAACSSRLHSLRIIHGTGKGVAAARNLALEHTQAEFVWFADSDDRWDVDIVRSLTEAAVQTDADLVLCNAKKVSAFDDADLGEIIDAPEFMQFTGAVALQRLFRGQLQGHLWNKLFRRSILGLDPFPSTRAHSDLGGLLRVLPRAKQVHTIPSTMYFYIVRAGSILNSQEYRWNDLWDCLEIARGSANAVGMSVQDADLRVFTQTHVALPLMNEVTRRARSRPAAEVSEARDRCRQVIDLSALASLVRRGHLLPALKLALFKVAPRAYMSIYARYRQRRWAALDTFK